MIRFIIILCSLVSAAHAAAPISISVYNKTEDFAIVSQNSDIVRPIASVTKLMTAMVMLDLHSDMDEKLKMTTRVKSNLPIQYYSKRDLLTAMLVRSDNAAAETFAGDYVNGRLGFIEAMNTKARQLGMTHTSFDDPSGLSKNNVSTAEDVSKMVAESLNYAVIKQTTVKKQAMFETYYKKKMRNVELPNTNSMLLGQFDNIDLSKTGFTNPAGWCLGLAAHQGSSVFIIVILGTPNKQARLNTAKGLLLHNIEGHHNSMTISSNWQIIDN